MRRPSPAARITAIGLPEGALSVTKAPRRRQLPPLTLPTEGSRGGNRPRWRLERLQVRPILEVAAMSSQYIDYEQEILKLKKSLNAATLPHSYQQTEIHHLT